jgi:hypothetical protein
MPAYVIPVSSHVQALFQFSKDPAPELENYFSELGEPEPKRGTQEAFIQGVKKFIAMANVPYSQRQNVFGHKFGGLHYNTKLKGLLMDTYPKVKVEASALYNICPPLWNCAMNVNNSLRILVYRGDKPSVALKELLKGPTVIDCAMFCELSFLYGTLKMLGEDDFNKCFRGTLYVTQIFAYPIEDPKLPENGNPMHPFLLACTSSELGPLSRVGFAYVSNNKHYRYKHPGGLSSGEACVVIEDKYFPFDPDLYKPIGLSRSEVGGLLVSAFNEGHNSDDLAVIKAYKKYPKPKIHPYFGINPAQLIERFKTFSSLTISIDDLPPPSSESSDNSCFYFNFEKFFEWVRQMRNQSLDSVGNELLKNRAEISMQDLYGPQPDGSYSFPPHFSPFTECMPLKSPATAAQVTSALFKPEPQVSTDQKQNDSNKEKSFCGLKQGSLK